MILNIISNQIYKDKIVGPKKVLINTLKGLDRLGIKYVFNKPINNYKYNWIHDNQRAIIEASLLNKSVVVGPNTAILPKDLPVFRKKLTKDSIYLHPSEWTVNIWKELNFNEMRLKSWPVGIDLDSFIEIENLENDTILVYFKMRDKNILNNVIDVLNEKKEKYILIEYGHYKEEEYKKALCKSKFCIWIGCSESQGIGLQEALASNIPIIVLDAISLFDTMSDDSRNSYKYKFPRVLATVKTSSAPYFDENCGIKIFKVEKLIESINYMNDNLDKFKPREFVEKNLSIQKCTNELISHIKSLKIKENSDNNYLLLSKVLYYISLLFQAWAWKLLFRKIFR
jgi:glycosyltransferase involved in cell wall biosynthesis